MLNILSEMQQASQFQDNNTNGAAGFTTTTPATNSASLDLPQLPLSNVNFVNKADPLVIKLKIAKTPVDISIG